MGNGKSKSAEVMAGKAKSDEIDQRLYKDRMEDQELIKLLLLGAGESGKSTLFRQMMRLYGKGFPGKERASYVPMVHGNTIESMSVLCTNAERLGVHKFSGDELEKRNRVVAAHKEGAESKEGHQLTPDLADDIKSLWQIDNLKQAFEERAQFQMIDSAPYFFNDAPRLAEPDYLPSETDIIMCRVKTTGIVEHRFTIAENSFLMVDVGGQRNERKKWIHCFEGVTAVIFVAALNEFDQTLYEDNETNRMEEALKLFSDTSGLRWFVDTSFVLFLNKRDLFKDKLSKHKEAFEKRFPDFHCDDNSLEAYYDAAHRYISSLFQQNYQQQNGTLYIHVTCATDKSNVAAVFGAVKDIIIRQHLQESGLL